MASDQGLGSRREASRPRGHPGGRGRGQGGIAAAIVELKSETDFVAKSDEFVSLADELAALVAAEGEDALSERQDEIDRLRTTLQENISVGEVVRIEAETDGAVDTYLHLQAGRGVNAVIVAVKGGDETLAHDIAAHIAFTRPSYITRDEVPAAEVDAERATVEEIARNEGKPEAGAAQDHRRPAQRLVQEPGPGRPGLYPRREADHCQAARGGRGDQVRPGRHRRLRDGAVGDRRRIVLKMSGEALASSASDETIDAWVVERIAVEIARARAELDLELAVMVGGGNIWRGTIGVGAGMDRATSDTMGMLVR